MRTSLLSLFTVLRIELGGSVRLLQVVTLGGLVGLSACRSTTPTPADPVNPVNPDTVAPSAQGTPTPQVSSIQVELDESRLAGGQDPAATSTSPDEEARRARAIGLIESGDYEGASEVLDELVVAQLLDQASKELARGQPESALVRLDDALARDDEDARGLRLKADASLALAEKGIAEGGSAGLIEGALEDALRYYQRCERSAEAAFGASRAAYLLGRNQDALMLARVGMEVLREDQEQGSAAPDLPVSPERIWSEAAFGAYTDARAEEAAGEDRGTLFAEAENALMSLAGQASDDPWVWSKLSDLCEWEGRYSEAQVHIQRGLERLPRDAGLLQRLSRVTRAASGAEAAVASFASYTEKHPSVALGHWHLGVERFDLATDELAPEELTPEAYASIARRYTEAESSFQRARELDESLQQSALGYEVMCRNGRGWAALKIGELERSADEFRSMNELFDQGIRWSVEGRLSSGVLGLAYVADAHQRLAEEHLRLAEEELQLGELEPHRRELLQAATLFEEVHGYLPDDDIYANNAGFFLRDAAVAAESRGRELCEAAHGRITNQKALAALRDVAGVTPDMVGTEAEREAFARRANELLAEARALMPRSWEVYQVAAELVPNDVRVVNDAALVPTYYLHVDIDKAEAMLLSAAELGEEQVTAWRARLQSEELSAEERAAQQADLALLNEAWGDAHQNLGLLYFLHRNDPERAIPHLEQAVEIGPGNRPRLGNNFIPFIRGEVSENTFFDLANWGAPCDAANAPSER